MREKKQPKWSTLVPTGGPRARDVKRKNKDSITKSTGTGNGRSQESPGIMGQSTKGWRN